MNKSVKSRGDVKQDLCQRCARGFLSGAAWLIVFYAVLAAGAKGELRRSAMRSRVHNAPATRNGVCRRGKHVNLFAGLLVDARDGGSYTYQHVGKRSTLVPVGAKQGHATKWTSFTSSPFENASEIRMCACLFVFG